MSISTTLRDVRLSLPALLASPRTVRLLRGAIYVLALGVICMFLGAALRRLHYPFDNEWVEDGNLIQVARMLHHLPLYVPPSIDYTPFIYAPLYFWISAQVSHFAGMDFAAMRLVSIASTLGVFGCIFALVYLESPRTSKARVLSATLAAGIFASMYVVSSTFFDLGRVDMLCLLFTALAMIAGRRGQPVLAALAWALALQTKQGVLPIAVLALAADWQKPRRMMLGLGSFAVFAGGSIWWLNRISDGWYGRYVFGVAGGFAILRHEVGLYIPIDLVQPLGLALLIVVAGLIYMTPRWSSERTNFYLFTALGMVGFTYYVRVHAGASANADLPAYLWVAVVAGISFERLYRWLSDAAQSGLGRQAGLAMLLLAACLQLLGHVFWMGDYVPGAGERAGRTRFIEQLRRIPGDVLIFEHPEYAVMAGKRQFADGEAVDALLSVKKLPYAEKLRAEYADLIDQHRVAAVVLDLDSDQHPPDYLPADFEQQYPVHVLAAGEPNRVFTSQPSWIRMRCKSADSPDPRALFPGTPIDDSRCAEVVIRTH